MPRTARAIVGGCCYHVINRGNNSAEVFHDRVDYAHFLSLLARAQERLTVPLLAACLMPNHLHLIVRPHGNGDLARWMQWLFTTHCRHQHARYGSTGRIWQGRFKAFLIQQDRHLLTVMRYVERNALRAGLVGRAEEWDWGSLRWRSKRGGVVQLARSPVGLPSDWAVYVNEPQTLAELEAIRTSVNRQRPYGDTAWVERKARDLGMTQSLAQVGRPKKRQ